MTNAVNDNLPKTHRETLIRHPPFKKPLRFTESLSRVIALVAHPPGPPRGNAASAIFAAVFGFVKREAIIPAGE
ncbi:MAG: hypothetical protein WD229_16380 [Pirellulales bacterium]